MPLTGYTGGAVSYVLTCLLQILIPVEYVFNQTQH